MPKELLLASDMDGTVIPLDQKKERDLEIKEFNRLVKANNNVILAYITGRHLELGLSGIEKYGLPFPQIFVCDVGTSIYHRENSHWVTDQAYREQLWHSWKNLTGNDIAHFLTEIAEIEVQENERQKEFKQSYYMNLKFDWKTVVQKIKNCLEHREIRANIIYSTDNLKKIGLIDVLPPIAAKDYALKYLTQRLNLAKDNVVYAGDSGNDLLAFVSGFNSIVVANTSDRVKKEALRQASIKGIEKRIFFAPSKYVKGVIEGCFHFNLFRE